MEAPKGNKKGERSKKHNIEGVWKELLGDDQMLNYHNMRIQINTPPILVQNVMSLHENVPPFRTYKWSTHGVVDRGLALYVRDPGFDSLNR